MENTKYGNVFFDAQTSDGGLKTSEINHKLNHGDQY